MNLKFKRAFSLIEVIIVLGLISVLAGVFVANFCTNFELQDDVSNINRAIKHARRLSIATNQPSFLSYDPGKFTLSDVFGEKISELKCKPCDATLDPHSKFVVKFDKFGFFTKFAVECGNTEYDAHVLSGALRKKER
ncbi:MAG: type II secretion system GspH family protein [Puniceicoccales bacterium]|nr:type II secretion system GspH family protein [Puniceicoccales bacterium]